MKQKWIKTVLAAAAVSIVTGGVCLGAGVAMGGSPGFYIDKDGIHVRENISAKQDADYVLKTTPTGTLKKLDIDLKDAELIIEQGDTWAVEYQLDGYRLAPEYSLENGTLTVRENQNHRDRNNYFFQFGDSWWEWENNAAKTGPYVRITVPEGAVLEEARFVGTYGDMAVKKNLRVSRMSVQLQDGSIRLDGWEGDTLTLDMRYGNVVAGKLNGKDMNIKSHDGAVKIEELSGGTVAFDMGYGELNASVNGTKSVDVETADGNVNLDLTGGIDRYGVSLHSEYGEIRLPDGFVEPDEYNENSDYIKMAGDSAGVRVYTESGSIRVREK